jgi:hypothetical protein
MRLYITTTIATIFLFACQSLRQPEFEKLLDAGLLPLSSTNPYVGSNMLLAKEIQDSTFLYHFIKQRGAPKVVSFDRTGDTMHLYYPLEKEYYIADFNDLEWIIRGPHPIKRSEYQLIIGYQHHDKDSTVLNIWGKTVKFDPTTPNVPHYLTELRLPTPTPRPQPPRKHINLKKQKAVIPALPQNMDQKALEQFKQSSK